MRQDPVARSLLVLTTALSVVACQPAALTQQMEARRLAADLHLQFTKAADASNRAVMADTDDVSASAATEAGRAVQAVQQDVEQLEPILKSLGYGDEIRFLGVFNERFAEYRQLDDEILPLAAENTNLKAQRLSFGPAREAEEAFSRALEGATRSAAPDNVSRAGALAATARAALLEIRVLHAPHIAEAEDAAMTRMEQEMAASDAAAQQALDALTRLLGTQAGPQLTEAAAALDRFREIHREIVTLSRRNSEVRSLALSLGRKRLVTATADDQLRGLEEALAKHAFTGTR